MYFEELRKLFFLTPIFHAFIQGVKSYPVCRLLFGEKTFIQCGKFNPLWRLLSIQENFIQLEELDPLRRT